MSQLNQEWMRWLKSQTIDMADNSTSEVIPDGVPFVGEWTEVPVGSQVYLSVIADQDLEIQLQWSPDGVNQDSTITRHYHTDGRIEPPHVFTNARPYFRLSVANDSGTDTTYTRVNTYVTMGGGELNVPVDGTVAQDFDAKVVRPTDFHTEVALGLRQGVTTWNKFGYNDDVDIGTEVIASWGGTFQYLTAGETIDIVSTSTADDDGGTGVHSVVVYGVDSNWDAATEVVTMDGTTTVTTTSTWIGINRVAIFLSGSGNTNAGTINVTATTSGYQMAQMPVGDGVTQQMIYYVPRNHQFLAEWVRFEALKTGGGGNPEIIFRGKVYSAVNQSEQEVYRGKLDTQRGSHVDVSPPVPFPIGEKSILYFTAETDTNNTQVSGRFSGEQFRNKSY